jgi:hypothetical protein
MTVPDFQWPRVAAAFLCAWLLAGESASAAPPVIPPSIDAALRDGRAQLVLVAFDATPIDAGARSARNAGARFDDRASLAYKAREYAALKNAVLGRLPAGQAQIVTDYSHLPLMLLRVKSRAAAGALVGTKDVVGVYEDRVYRTTLTQSRPLIGQPAVVAAGATGANHTVVVLDTGVDYTLADFGSCSAPNTPASCRVVVAQDLAPNDGILDDNGHGTNVSGIVAGVATGAKLAVFDVFSGSTASSSTIISGINWAIANQATYDIVAINMSLGDSTKYTAPCASIVTNPFLTPIANARAAGILTVVASGNDAYTDGISNPACTPDAISVGAVYDANVGSIQYTGLCTDATTAADKVTCFSNSAGFLTLLAPGALITAAGSTKAGTSQATPHVAGAVAMLREQFPADALDAVLARLTDHGTPVLDTRNGVTKPRLNLLESARPDNDAFADATTLGATPGQIDASNVLASKQTDEPNHAGNSGGASVWFAWIAPVSGDFSFTTQGSTFDTLLAVYQGATLSALTVRASNNDDGSGGGASTVTLNVVAGQTYWIAVDGYNGATGAVQLTWAAATLDDEIPLLSPWAMAALALALGAASRRARHAHARQM